MSILTILETLLIGPLKLVFEVIFALALRFVNHPGLAIIFLSLVMNILVLPLYRRADAMQEASRDTEKKLHKGVEHIKKTFSGDEQMMILQTYYRQNNYKPTDALNGSVSLLLEIPFFMAAYQFLSHLDILNGVSFGPIADLGAQDGLLVIGGIAINVLPILMTLINVISSAIYLKGFPLKTKIQLYGMALFFLVFLYTSPSCLVFYWTLNNLFSLIKTIFYKLKNPQKVLQWLLAIFGTVMLVYALGFYSLNSTKLRVVMVALGIVCIAPLICSWVDFSRFAGKAHKEPVPDKKLFIWGSIFLTVLVGLVIPTTYIAASPQEYVDLAYFEHPLWYVVSSAAMAAGTFLIWLRVFYWLASNKWKVFFERMIWVLCGLMMINYIFFGTNLGNISSTLKYDNGMLFTIKDQLINLLVMVSVGVVMYLIITRWNKAVTAVLLTASLALTAMAGLNIVKINNSISQLNTEQSSEVPVLTLSTKGQNVIVLMFDRALAEDVPYIFNEKPELKEQFEGFTYYRNTVSFGKYTNFCTPSLFGGYEYTPVEINKRSSESLASKQNEALQVMPVMFMDEGYDVTVCDPVYANYQWAPDTSIYDEYPEINTYVTEGFFDDADSKIQIIQNRHRNFFCFSLMKCLPVALQSTVYNDGNYNQIQSGESETVWAQTCYGISASEGLNPYFMKSYNVLDHMDLMTQVVDDDSNTFLMMVNNTTHDPMLLQTPDYRPANEVDNTAYDEEHADRFTLDGHTIYVDNEYRMIHYHANMATFLRLGEWMDYLRENNVYDNTRIIIVSDHGRDLYQTPELIHSETYLGNYYPLLFVKDFAGSGDIVTSDEFMTIADVPTLAVEGLIDTPVNPFTGKEITNDEKNAHEQFVIISEEWDVATNNGNTFLPSYWASVKDDLWDQNNWTFYDKETVLTEYASPDSK